MYDWDPIRALWILATACFLVGCDAAGGIDLILR